MAGIIAALTAVLVFALKGIGFGVLGPIGGSIAAFIQSFVYGAAVPAGSLFSFFQWLAMILV